MLRSLIRIPFTTPSNSNTTMDVLVEKKDKILTFFFPQLSIHRLYNITRYVVDITGKGTKRIYIEPYDLLAQLEIRHKDNAYCEHYSIDIGDDSKIQVEISCEVRNTTPDWLQGIGVGVIQREDIERVTLTHDIDNIYINIDNEYRKEIIEKFL